MTKRLTIALVALAVVLLFVALPASARVQVSVNNVTTPGANVYIGEQGLNLTPAQFVLDPKLTNANASLAWWASAANVQSTPPTKTISLLGRNTSFMVAPSDFSGYAGNWYLYNGSVGGAVQPAIINANDPTMDIRIWDNSFTASQSGSDVTGGSVIQGDMLSFRVDTNIYQAYNGQRADAYNSATPAIAATVANGGLTPADDGYLDIKVKTAAGNTLTGLWNNSYDAAGDGVVQPLTYQNVTYQPWFWGQAPGSVVSTTAGLYKAGSLGNWSTGATDSSGQAAYPAGTYTVTATSYLNAMYDNYLNGGAYYTDKTVSEARTVTILSNSVSLTANQDTVVRSKAFSVTITGRPNTVYHLWLKGTSSMDGSYDNLPPYIQSNQAGVVFDTSAAAAQVPAQYPYADNGNYSWQNGGGWPNGNIYNSVSHASAGGQGAATINSGLYEYANVTLDQTGTRTVGFSTTNWTKAQQYTVRVEQNFGGQLISSQSTATYSLGEFKSDEVTVTVQKGAVTIVAAGDQSYYLGEQIDFSGTNTESSDTYLFIEGPNLPTYGGDLNGPRNYVPPQSVPAGSQAGNLVDASVAGDNTWSYNWGTSNLALDAGTYTIYAVSQPTDGESGNLANVAYGTVSIVIKKPFVSATASSSVVAQGDSFDITGTAQGDPTIGVQIWILGKNYEAVKQQSVNSDSSFDYTVERSATTNLYTGQYFVVVQHPMMNNQFDITTFQQTTTSPIIVINKQSPVPNSAATDNYQQLFQLTGSGALQGSDAAEALVEGLNSPNVDDTYTKLQFLVEVPTITVDPIGDRHVGDKFTVTGETNLAVGDQILVEIYSSSFTPTQKTQSGAFSGATGTVTVVAGTGTGGLNTWSFNVDASTFKPDEYLVTATSVLTTGTGTALFNVLEGAAPTAAPTAVATTAAPTMVIPTTVPTTVATPVPTQTTTPGFGALVALIGLGAVAFVIVRRH
jgi:PGF-CTERM protein